jgi:hypothetical protein
MSNESYKAPKIGNVRNGYENKQGLILGDLIFSVSKLDNGMVEFIEECDGHHSMIMTKEEAIGVFEAFINFVNSV